MGRRGRRGGVTNAALRAARAAAMAQDEAAQQIARRVYGIAVELRGVEAPLPLPLWAPLYAAAEQAAIDQLLAAGVKLSRADVELVTTHLVTGFARSVVQVTPELLESWKAEVAGESAHGRVAEGE